MARINIVTPDSANPEQKALYDAIHAQLGMVPNFLKVFANSPAALKAFLGLHGIAGDGSLDPQTRERIALALAQQNSCEYCLSAHTAIGRKAGLVGPRSRPTAPVPARMKRRPSPSGLPAHWSLTWEKSPPTNYWKCAMPATANPTSLRSSPTSA
jgi:AhpD family alkylhydroperoxidase